MDRATRLLGATAFIFLVLCVVLMYGAREASAGPPAAAADASPTATATPVDLRGCQVGGRQADYGQTGSSITVLPLEQHDESGFAQWVTTWRASGPAGLPVVAEVATYRCVGRVPVPGWDNCMANDATVSSTQTITFTIPASGTFDFSAHAPVDCCEVDETDLVSINGERWGASFFVRWAQSPFCPFTGTPTPTVTETPTATATSTPTSTATPVFRKEPWHPLLEAGNSQRYNIILQNTTGKVMTGIVVTDVIPQGSRFSDATLVSLSTTPPEPFSWYPAGGTWDGNRTVTWNIGTLPAGYYASMKVHVYATSGLAPGTVLTNTAKMRSGAGSVIIAQATSVIVASAATSTPMATPTFTPIPDCPALPVIQADTGSSASYTDTRGALWLPDQAYHPGTNTWGYIGTSNIYTTSSAVLGTGDPALYRSERWWTGNGGYRFEVPDGDYQVVLKLAEIYPETHVGTRVFSIAVQSTTVLAHLDVLGLAGMNVAYDLVVPAHVSNGTLVVDLIAEQSSPALKAIAVLSPRSCSHSVTPSVTASPVGQATVLATIPVVTPTQTPTATAISAPSATPTATRTGEPTSGLIYRWYFPVIISGHE